MNAVRPFLELLLPSTLARAAGRAGTISLALAVLVAVFFPQQARAGTEVAAARWVTAGALAVAGLGLTYSRGRLTVVALSFAVLVAGALAAPATWLLAFAGGAMVYAAMPLVRGGSGEPAVHLQPDPPMGEVQEVLEAVGMALVLALVVREFGFEAFKIPTGSMEPTILGDASGRKGDRLLAFKPAPVRRWDVVVFRFPLFRKTNYIKRLVGLPGERLELRDGDVYVNGAIASKPDDVQSLMWRRARVLAPDEDWAGDFDADRDSGWTYATGSASVRADASGGAEGDGIAWTQVGGSFEDDLRVAFDVEATSPAGDLYVSLDGGHRRCVLRVGPESCEISAPGVPSWDPGIRGFAELGTRFRLGFSMADRIVRVFADGRRIASLRHDDAPNDGLDVGRVRLGARGLSATVRALVVENDVRYDPAPGGPASWDVPADGCFMLGDNSGTSQDSRYWKANLVRTKDGREFTAPDMARVTDDSQVRTYFPTGDGGVRFLDSYGIRHEFTKDEIAELRGNVRFPFAKEEDIVGRAFFVFFPFPPFGDFRPRLLR